MVEPVEKYSVQKILPKAKKAKSAAKSDSVSPAEKASWPSEVSEQFMAIRQLLRQEDRPWTVEEVQARFKSSRKETLRQRLEALEGLGVVRRQSMGDSETWIAQ